MKDLSKQCTELMIEYIKDRNLPMFIFKLRAIEKEYGDEYKSLWFKFSDDDSLATTVNDIDKTLSLPPFTDNYKYLIERFEYAIEFGTLKANIS